MLGKPRRAKAVTDFPARPPPEGFSRLPAPLPSLNPGFRRSAAVPQAIGLIARFEDVAMLTQAVQECRGLPGVAKDRAPFPEGEISGDSKSKPAR